MRQLGSRPAYAMLGTTGPRAHGSTRALCSRPSYTMLGRRDIEDLYSQVVEGKHVPCKKTLNSGFQVTKFQIQKGCLKFTNGLLKGYLKVNKGY